MSPAFPETGRRASPLHGGPGETLAFILFETLGRAIAAGAYRARAFPTHNELGREYGVSRSVTREALKMLAAKGMIGSRPRLGNFVLPYDCWNLFDPDVLRWLAAGGQPSGLTRKLAQLRTAFEPEAASLAAQYARPAQIEAIRGAVAPLLDSDQPDSGIEPRIAFHLSILRATNNPFFTRYSEMIAPALRLPAICLARADAADHRAVFAAIASRACSEARDAMRLLLAKGDIGGDSAHYPGLRPEDARPGSLSPHEGG